MYGKVTGAPISHDPDQCRRSAGTNNTSMAFDPRRLSILEVAGVTTIILSAVALASVVYAHGSIAASTHCVSQQHELNFIITASALGYHPVTERHQCFRLILRDRSGSRVRRRIFEITVFSLGALSILLTVIALLMH